MKVKNLLFGLLSGFIFVSLVVAEDVPKKKFKVIDLDSQEVQAIMQDNPDISKDSLEKIEIVPSKDILEDQLDLKDENYLEVK